MSVHPDRIQSLNNHRYEQGPVVYWMNRDQRAHDNWALLHAQEIALLYKVPLYVIFNLDLGFLGGGYRQHAFKVKGLQETAQEFEEKNISFALVTGTDTVEDILKFLKKIKAGYLVTDFFPLHLPRAWGNKIRKEISIPFDRVDAHNIVPCWVASTKQEFAARTIRPKLYKLLPEFLTDIPKLKKHPFSLPQVSPALEAIDWKKILNHAQIDQSVQEIDWLVPGSKAGHRVMQNFIQDKLSTYADDRNNPNLDGQSNISPYFHYGHIAPQRVAWEVLQTSGKLITEILHAEKNGSRIGGSHESAFLEEMIVRRELSDNFCFYNESYDSFEGFPDWAKTTLEKHEKDEREFTYTKKQFEHAETHDNLWNAAQQQMVCEGKMHGYVRMYWAKKILEWSENAKSAMKIAVYLNDKYELDGRDPNGYVGCAWSIGGVHDRPWFDRPIFGVVRYMALSGMEKKFDVQGYIEKWGK